MVLFLLANILACFSRLQVQQIMKLVSRINQFSKPNWNIHLCIKEQKNSSEWDEYNLDLSLSIRLLWLGNSVEVVFCAGEMTGNEATLDPLLLSPVFFHIDYVVLLHLRLGSYKHSKRGGVVGLLLIYLFQKLLICPLPPPKKPQIIPKPSVFPPT